MAAVRSAVRRVLSALPEEATVLVACSGGADSLALAGAVAFEAPRMGRGAGAVTVDHGLQEGSARRAQEVSGVLRGLGLDPVQVRTVAVGREGGPEASARRARYGALEEAADSCSPAAVLLGHTLDDQAETVLLGLARGSGARSLAAMAPRTARYARPLLELERATVHRACDQMGLAPWDDPHNHDARFARSRVRHEALPALEKSLGPGIAAALARTAGMLRADTEALDQLAGQLRTEAERGPAPAADTAAETEVGAGHPAAHAGRSDRDDHGPAPGDPGSESPVQCGPQLAVGPLAAAPAALRTRVLRRAALSAGCPAGALNARHVHELERLVTEWRGQSHIDLPGGIRGRRVSDRIRFER